MTVCAVEGCREKCLARGWCSRHYERNRKTGSPTGSRRKTFEERFWEKVDKTESCWNWTASKNPAGYGLINNSGSTRYAHRIAYQAAHGPLPDDLHVDHRCLNPSCVNPAHLRPATPKQNNEHRRLDPRSISGVRGVSWHAGEQKWRGTVGHDGKRYSLGYFTTVEEAAKEVLAKRLELFTHNDLDRKAS